MVSYVSGFRWVPILRPSVSYSGSLDFYLTQVLNFPSNSVRSSIQQGPPFYIMAVRTLDGLKPEVSIYLETGFPFLSLGLKSQTICLLLWAFSPLWAFHFLSIIGLGSFHGVSWHNEQLCNVYFDSWHTVPIGKGLGSPFVTKTHTWSYKCTKICKDRVLHKVKEGETQTHKEAEILKGE